MSEEPPTVILLLKLVRYSYSYPNPKLIKSVRIVDGSHLPVKVLCNHSNCTIVFYFACVKDVY